MKILNALSLNMYDGDSVFPVTTKLTKDTLVNKLWVIDEEYGARKKISAPQFREVESAIGHESTAQVVENYLLSIHENLNGAKDYAPKIETNRCTVSFRAGDIAIIVQYHGERLAEGVTTLPEGSHLIFWLVEFKAKKHLKTLEKIYNELQNVAHDVAGYGYERNEDEVTSFLKKWAGRYFDAHAFD